MAGLGIAYSRAGAELPALAEHLRVPVTVTAQSKGHFPEDHPLFAGTFGVYTDAPIYDLINEADLWLAGKNPTAGRNRPEHSQLSRFSG